MIAELKGSDTVAGDRFGGAVAISGTTAVVGASYRSVWSAAPTFSPKRQPDGSRWPSYGSLTKPSAMFSGLRGNLGHDHCRGCSWLR